MKLKAVLAGILFLLLTIALRVPLASACEPSDLDVHCAVRQMPRRTPTRARTLSVVAKNVPRGDSPANALEMQDAWRTLDPGASVWYKTDDSSGFRALRIWLDANGRGGLSLAIFSPDQMEGVYSIAKPIGRGTFNKLDPSHDLLWSSDYARWGVWYALVTNSNVVPASYKVGYTQTGKDAKTCVSYWEWIGKDYVYWTNCNPN